MSEMRSSDSTKIKKNMMSFNFSLDPLTTESELKRLHKENSSFSTSQVTGLYLDFVKLGFVGSVSFIF